MLVWQADQVAADSRRHDVFNLSFQNLPTYLRSTGFADPNSSKGPLQAAHDMSLSLFGWLQANPPYGPAFNNYMKGYRPIDSGWLAPGCYPVVEGLAAKANKFAVTGDISDVVLVDVGGGLGHDCEALRTKYPEVVGRLVVQDLPKVVEQIPAAKHALFEPMAHDFFTPQPVKGAVLAPFTSLFMPTVPSRLRTRIPQWQEYNVLTATE